VTAVMTGVLCKPNKGYDCNGNQVTSADVNPGWKYQYDVENRLVSAVYTGPDTSATSTTSLEYDPAGGG